MYASLFDEGTLGIGDEVIHERSQSKGKHFRNNLGDPMDEANRPKVRNVVRPVLLREEGNVGGI
jgi:hypothetical protein